MPMQTGRAYSRVPWHAVKLATIRARLQAGLVPQWSPKPGCLAGRATQAEPRPLLQHPQPDSCSRCDPPTPRARPTQVPGELSYSSLHLSRSGRERRARRRHHVRQMAHKAPLSGVDRYDTVTSGRSLPEPSSTTHTHPGTRRAHCWNDVIFLSCCPCLSSCS